MFENSMNWERFWNQVIESDFGGPGGESNPQSGEDWPDLKSGVEDHFNRPGPWLNTIEKCEKNPSIDKP